MKKGRMGNIITPRVSAKGVAVQPVG
jgi:hypothetical protein